MLTKQQRKVLQFLVDNPDEDIVIEGRMAFYGNETTSVALIYSLLRLCVISSDQYSEIRYSINETGKNLLMQ